MAASEMSRRSRRRRAYPLRQPPERAEGGMRAHSSRFGNFRNLPKQAGPQLGGRSAISGQTDAAALRLPEPVRQFPPTEKTRDTCPSIADTAPITTSRATPFFFFIFRKLPKGPEGSKRGVIIRPRRPRIAPPPRYPPPVVLAGSTPEISSPAPLSAACPLPPPPGPEEVITTQILAPVPAHGGVGGTPGKPAEGSGLRRSLLRSAPQPPPSALHSSLPPSSLPCLRSSAAPHAPRQRVSAAAPRSGEMALELLLYSRPLFFFFPPTRLPGKASADPPGAKPPQPTPIPSPTNKSVSEPLSND